MLKTIDADNAPIRVIVSKMKMFKDEHRFMAEWDFDREVSPEKDDYLKGLLNAYGFDGIYIRTRGGAHFVSSNMIKTFDEITRRAKVFEADPKWIEINKKRGYACLRVTQKYASLDLQIDRSYPRHNEELAVEYEKLLQRYKNYFTFKHPIKAYRMRKQLREKDLLTQYVVKHNLDDTSNRQAIYTNSYGGTSSMPLYSSRYI